MKEISVTELAGMLPDEGGRARIIDVREDNEHVAAHVAGTTHLPLSRFAEGEAELPDDETLYILCHSGARSAQVTQHLNGRDVDAVNVSGGIVAWYQAGLPVVMDSPAR